jgi:hypothetical protein
MRRRWLLLVAAGLCMFGWAWLAKEAGAHEAHHATTDPVTLALALGEKYWGVAPCEGRISVSASSQEPVGAEGPLPASEAAISMWATLGSCSFTINSRLWPNWEADDIYFQLFCDEVTHELGHLAPLDRRDDTPSPTSIEYGVIETTSPNYNAVPQCKGQALWYGPLRFTG